MRRQSLGRAFWEGVVADFEGGGGTQREVARRHGISVTGLQRWLRVLRDERKHRAAVPPAVQLLPVRVSRNGGASR